MVTRMVHGPNVKRTAMGPPKSPIATTIIWVGEDADICRSYASWKSQPASPSLTENITNMQSTKVTENFRGFPGMLGKLMKKKLNQCLFEGFVGPKVWVWHRNKFHSRAGSSWEIYPKNWINGKTSPFSPLYLDISRGVYQVSAFRSK